MFDPNWELINGPVAHQIEILNATNQGNVLDGLMFFLLAHKGPMHTGNPPMPDEAALLTLHHAGTLFLLANPGVYRNVNVSVCDRNGTLVHQPPEWQDVAAGMQTFFRNLSSIWTSGDALDVASYALWHINWIHPFRNGNGRTARAFSYACLCLKFGNILPGTPTVIDQIMNDRPGYEAALRAADKTFETPPHLPDLAPMKAWLSRLLSIQIVSVTDAGVTGARPAPGSPDAPEPGT